MNSVLLTVSIQRVLLCAVLPYLNGYQCKYGGQYIHAQVNEQNIHAEGVECDSGSIDQHVQNYCQGVEPEGTSTLPCREPDQHGQGQLRNNSGAALQWTEQEGRGRHFRKLPEYRFHRRKIFAGEACGQRLSSAGVHHHGITRLFTM